MLQVTRSDIYNCFTHGFCAQNVYNEGGRYFWIHNTGPVGCLPYVMERIPILVSQIDRAGCASPFNEVAQDFNRALKKVVDRLRRDLASAAITYVDVYSVKYALISRPKRYGKIKSVRLCKPDGSFVVRTGSGAVTISEAGSVAFKLELETNFLV